MGKLKDIWNGEHRSFVRYAVCVTAVFLVYVCFLGQDSMIRWAGAGLQLRSQRRAIERYQKEIKAMDDQVKKLSTDPDSLERFARENFHFSAPGEDVYIDNQ